MEGLSPRIWQLAQTIFLNDAEKAGRILVDECGQNLPFCRGRDEFQLARFRFAALRISNGNLVRLHKPVDEAKRDWANELLRAK